MDCFKRLGLASNSLKPTASKWTHRELNPDLRHARAVSSLWTMSPIEVERSTRELNPAFRSTKAACGLKHLETKTEY